MIDFDEWHAEVHGRLPYSELLHSDDRLRDMLLSLDLPKYVFTNADRKHAQICLDLLGIADCFEVSSRLCRDDFTLPGRWLCECCPKQ